MQRMVFLLCLKPARLLSGLKVGHPDRSLFNFQEPAIHQYESWSFKPSVQTLPFALHLLHFKINLKQHTRLLAQDYCDVKLVFP